MEKRIRELLAAEYAEQRSQEWLDLRENMITASDIAANSIAIRIRIQSTETTTPDPQAHPGLNLARKH
jgi:hypothetical protein